MYINSLFFFSGLIYWFQGFKHSEIVNISLPVPSLEEAYLEPI